MAGEGGGGGGGMWWIELIKKGIEDTKGAGFSAIAANQQKVDFAPYMNMFQAAGGLAGTLMNLFQSRPSDNRTSAIHNPGNIDQLRSEYNLDQQTTPPAGESPLTPYTPEKNDVAKEYAFNRWMQSVMNGANYQSYTPTYAQDNAWV